ncbi:MAG: hypothetical protein INQ03_13725 [Candidatus Heimdallarchaeota archaeon]|nr:hypothetical protein [Candidatus Heimdallarchaeota archaeon]
MKCIACNCEVKKYEKHLLKVHKVNSEEEWLLKKEKRKEHKRLKSAKKRQQKAILLEKEGIDCCACKKRKLVENFEIDSKANKHNQQLCDECIEGWMFEYAKKGIVIHYRHLINRIKKNIREDNYLSLDERQKLNANQLLDAFAEQETGISIEKMGDFV